jgi:sulfoxide reductase catalytic subunit YedY
MRHFRVPPIPASQITPEVAFRERRRLLAGLAAMPLALSGCGDEPEVIELPSPVQLPSDPFRSDEPQTRYEDATGYNNFYEFGTSKNAPSRNAHRLKPAPWSVEIAGEAEVTGNFAPEDLLAGHSAQERIYRMRCVEGWSMVIPWSGIPLADVLARFKPTSRAKYVAFTSLADRDQMPGMALRTIDWPYVEGLRIDEAMHPLTLLATGMYGKPLPNQNGAPLRLIVPWKYGFKGIKSIVRIAFVEHEPPTSWNRLQPSEYGFYANVNPAVDHPRWSQKTERRIAGDSRSLFAHRIPTLAFNGYGEQVAGLYAGMDLRRYF